MPHPALIDLHAALARVHAGEYAPLGGPHAYDADRAAASRDAAVLALFTPTLGDQHSPGVDVFLVQRSPALRHHPGQIALPGGRLEPSDTGPEAAAVRETEEETGIPATQITVLGALPRVLVPVSGFAVTPVLGWADHVAPTVGLDDGEILHTVRLPVAQLLDPAARGTVSLAGHGSCGFRIETGWVWGFTGNLLDHLFTELGWTRPWDHTREHAMSWDEARGAQLLD
ncbi:NUDIX hydrolase [Ruania halotolerans]|uniref:NUDIX hydrolase n=1 Tax=Ruania halotolerans TaxID=2897773 RepID=UPI001E538054|nr:CoA pyrophosphatase [Ruania halotolerans]UFU05541.1 CoA pyrophosphatase [Ruania halotolerans]